MTDLILTTGDKAVFTLMFGQAIVAARPGNLIGSGKDKINGKPVCVEGDEKNVIVPECIYINPQYSIPGVGILTIESLTGNQKAKKSKSNGKFVLLKGWTFKAKFQVTVPTQQPSTPAIPEATPKYSGTRIFITTKNAS